MRKEKVKKVYRANLSGEYNSKLKMRVPPVKNHNK